MKREILIGKEHFASSHRTVPVRFSLFAALIKKGSGGSLGKVDTDVPLPAEPQR
jgi:hypothetical protein